jgi:hypothetical protein
MLHTHICYLSCCCSISIYFVILPTHSHFAHSVCVAMVKHGWAAVPCSEPNRKLVSFSNAAIGSCTHVLCHQNWSVPVKFGDAESKWCGCVLCSLLSRSDGRSRMLSLALFQSWKLTFFFFCETELKVDWSCEDTATSTVAIGLQPAWSSLCEWGVWFPPAKL